MMTDGDDNDDKNNDDCAISIETCGGGNGVFVGIDQFQEGEEKEIFVCLEPRKAVIGITCQMTKIPLRVFFVF